MFKSIAAAYLREANEKSPLDSPLDFSSPSIDWSETRTMSTTSDSAYQDALKPGKLGSDTATEPRSKDVASATLEAEIAWILENLTVVEPKALLNATFGETAVRDTYQGAFSLKGVFSKEMPNQCQLESEMYEPLTRAFNQCIGNIQPADNPGEYCPTHPLQCIDISRKRYSLAQEMSFTTKMGPDLCLTFDSTDIEDGTPCNKPNVLIEVKLDLNTDILIGSKGKGSQISKERKKLMRQLFGYVAYGQWPSLPYRFSWTISISGNSLRLWRWSASGVIVTEPVYFLQDPTSIVQFVRLLASGPYSRLGIDIGHGMTFSSISKKSLGGAIKKYLAAIPEIVAKSRWVEKAKKAHLLVLNPVQSDRGSILVVSQPISSTCGIFCRGTRCYLAVYELDAEKGDDIGIEDIHILKTSWQDPTRTAEHLFFERANARSSEGAIPHLATVLCAAEIPSTRQQLGRFQKHPDSTLPNDEILESNHTQIHFADPPQVVTSHPRALQWILFKEMGCRLHGFRTVKQMVQAFCDAITAHQFLCGVGILHRDISEGNILIDLSTGRGLLIDLDMAQDLLKIIPPTQEPANTLAMTGTLRFMSLALQKRPIHRSWHDLESFFWLLVYTTLKHVPDAALREDADKVAGRMQGLKSIFPDGAQASDLINNAKQKFLDQGHIKATGNEALGDLLVEFRHTFRKLHQALQQAHTCWLEWTSLAKVIELPNDSLLRIPYSIESLVDLRQHCDASDAALEVLTKREHPLDLRTKVNRHLRDISRSIDEMKGAVNLVSIFPDHRYILDNIKGVLLDNSELDPNSPSFDYEELLDAEIRLRGSSSVVQAKRSRPATARSGSMGSFGRRASVSSPMATISERRTTRSNSTTTKVPMVDDTLEDSTEMESGMESGIRRKGATRARIRKAATVTESASNESISDTVPSRHVLPTASTSRTASPPYKNPSNSTTSREKRDVKKSLG